MHALKNKKTNLTKEITVKCPNCQKTVIWNAQQLNKPFCSERCKLIDLGEWAAGEKIIPGKSMEPESTNDFDPFLN